MDRGESGSRPDLTNASLVEAALSQANLRVANLGAANLSGADLYAANLREANLSEANLRDATLVFADLTGTILNRTNLSLADLTLADLSLSDLSGTVLDKARIGDSIFGNVDLSEVIGLENVIHSGPSTMALDTLQRSKGNISEVFLKGCGLRDWEIESAKLYRRGLSATEINDIVHRVYELRAGQPLQYHSCFISYASEDENFAHRFYDNLQDRGVRCWFAPHDMRPGRKIHEQISQAIQLQDKLLLILSPASIGSDWVKYEIAKARKREVMENRQILFPLALMPFEALENWECFEADTATDLAAEIRSYFIPDFSKWDTHHKAYEEAFRRLVSSLAASKEAPAARSDPS